MALVAWFRKMPREALSDAEGLRRHLRHLVETGVITPADIGVFALSGEGVVTSDGAVEA